MKRSRFSEAQIIGILKEHQAGMSAPELCRKSVIRQAIYFNWTKKYAGLTPSEKTQLNELSNWYESGTVL